MRLRGAPPPVKRLSRRVIAGLAVVSGVVIAGALIYALQARHDTIRPTETPDVGLNRVAPDGLINLPSDYSGVPQLGPPLPGDLGRPILSAQNGQAIPGVATGNFGNATQMAQETDAARASRLFVSTQPRNVAAAATPTPSALPATDLAHLGLAPPAATPSAVDRQLAFLNGPADSRVLASGVLSPAPSPYILQAGSVIPAALLTGLRSDLPGQITAQVTENVYDSPTGKILLVPQGAKLLGQYDSDVGFGQRRVLLVWTRLLLPNGKSITLDRQPGADAEGFAGLEDGVDYHVGNIATAAALSTLLGVGAELAANDDNRLVQAIRSGAQDTINDAGQQIVRQQLSVQPTLTVRQGFPVRVLVTRDLILEPYGN